MARHYTLRLLASLLPLVVLAQVWAPPTHAEKPSVVRSGARLVASLPLTAKCPAAADGSCQATANLSGRSGAGIAALIGTASRSLVAGESWDVRVNLTPTGVRVLREDGSMKVLALVAVERPDGRTTSKTAELTLRRPVARNR